MDAILIIEGIIFKDYSSQAEPYYSRNEWHDVLIIQGMNGTSLLFKVKYVL